jgi:hypothetical protein
MSYRVKTRVPVAEHACCASLVSFIKLPAIMDILREILLPVYINPGFRHWPRALLRSPEKANKARLVRDASLRSSRSPDYP